MNDYNKNREKALEIIICVLVVILIILGGIATYLKGSNENSTESLKFEESILLIP